MTDTWAVVGPDNTVHYRREVGYKDGVLFEVFDIPRSGYWLRRVKRDPEGRVATKGAQARHRKEAMLAAKLIEVSLNAKGL